MPVGRSQNPRAGLAWCNLTGECYDYRSFINRWTGKLAIEPVFTTKRARGEFERLAQKYSWDLRSDEAKDWPKRLVRRVMDIGTLDDIISMEQAFGRDVLIDALIYSEIGALRPQSWAFWHHRLGLVETGGRCPAYPVRRFA